MNTISFMTSNYVARPLGYQMTGGWAEGVQANTNYFRPLDTFADRFGGMLRDIRALGFGAVDIWTAQLNWEWATDEHLAIARDFLANYDLRITCLAGSFGRTHEHMDAACRVARAIGAPLLSGMTYLLATNRRALVDVLRAHGLRLGVENHTEKTPAALLRKIAGGEEAIGVALDTGWFATQGYPPVQAIYELRESLLHVHLKDILAAGQHETCRYGQGRVPVEACVRQLQRVGYTGPISIEHEPTKDDPGADCQACLAMVQSWLS